jgi:hypothetical protein
MLLCAVSMERVARREDISHPPINPQHLHHRAGVGVDHGGNAPLGTPTQNHDLSMALRGVGHPPQGQAGRPQHGRAWELEGPELPAVPRVE